MGEHELIDSKRRLSACFIWVEGYIILLHLFDRLQREGEGEEGLCDFCTALIDSA
jgi:hypothetical protein